MAKTIRPFRGLDDLQGLLDKAIFEINGKSVKGMQTLVPAEVGAANASLRLELDSSAFTRALAKAGLSSDDVEIVTHRLGGARRLIELNRSIPNPKSQPRTVEVIRNAGLEGDHLYGDENGFSLGVSVVLARKMQRERLRPFLQGTWLAEVKLEVRAHEEADAGPQLKKLDDETIAALQAKGVRVGPATMTYVDFTQKLLTSPLVSAVVVYVNEGLGDAIKQQAETKSEAEEQKLRFHFARMAVDATSAIAVQVGKEIFDLDPADVHDEARIKLVIQSNDGLVHFLSFHLLKSAWGQGKDRESAAAEVVYLAYHSPDNLRAMLEQCTGVGLHLPDTLRGK
jgi:hypothetical protein